MKTNYTLFTLQIVGLLVSLPALAQPGTQTIQAIDRHLQQTRTAEQRKAMETKSADALPPGKTTNSQQPKKKATKKKPKAVKKPETVQPPT